MNKRIDCISFNSEQDGVVFINRTEQLPIGKDFYFIDDLAMRDDYFNRSFSYLDKESPSMCIRKCTISRYSLSIELINEKKRFRERNILLTNSKRQTLNYATKLIVYSKVHPFVNKEFEIVSTDCSFPDNLFIIKQFNSYLYRSREDVVIKINKILNGTDKLPLIIT